MWCDSCICDNPLWCKSTSPYERLYSYLSEQAGPIRIFTWGCSKDPVVVMNRIKRAYLNSEYFCTSFFRCMIRHFPYVMRPETLSIVDRTNVEKVSSNVGGIPCIKMCGFIIWLSNSFKGFKFSFCFINLKRFLVKKFPLIVLYGNMYFTWYEKGFFFFFFFFFLKFSFCFLIPSFIQC